MVNSPPPELLPEEPVDPAEDEATEPNQVDQPSSIDSIKQLRPAQPKGNQTAPQPTAEQRQNAWGKLNNVLQDARNKLGRNKTPNQTPENKAAQAIEQKGKETIRRAEQKAVKKIAQQAGKQVALQGGKVVAAATSEFWVPVLVIIGAILFLVILVIAIFAFVSFSGRNGSGPGKYPSSAEEKFAATQLLALSGDAQASAAVITAEVDEMKSKLTKLKTAAQKEITDSSRRNNFNARVDEITADLDRLKAAAQPGPERQKMISDLNVKLVALSKDFPEAFFTSGDCGALAPYIENKKFAIGPKGQPNAKNIVQGKLSNKAGQIYPANPGLCSLLLYLFKNGVELGTDTFSMGHEKYVGSKTSGKTISQHWCGEAIDIGTVNGKHVGNNDETKKAMQLILDAKASGIAVWDSFGPFYSLQLNNGAPHNKNIGGHDTHIHFSGKPVNIACLQGKK